MGLKSPSGTETSAERLKGSMGSVRRGAVQEEVGESSRGPAEYERPCWTFSSYPEVNGRGEV